VARDTALVRTYGQYCPIARGAEIFAERWTPLIIRNLHLGCETFGEILEGAPGLSRTLLTQRLTQLERVGIVESAPKAHGRGHRYQLTTSGHDLFKVCETLGEWGARWLEIAPENLDPFVALWSMCNALRRDRLPDQRVVIRLDFTGFRPHERYWLLVGHGEAEICKTYAGLDEDLYITADAEAFVKWHAGQLSWEEATRDSRIRLHGPSWLVRGVPELEPPQHVRPHQARRRRCHRDVTQCGCGARRGAAPARRGRISYPSPGWDSALGRERGTHPGDGPDAFGLGLAAPRGGGPGPAWRSRVLRPGCGPRAMPARPRGCRAEGEVERDQCSFGGPGGPLGRSTEHPGAGVPQHDEIAIDPVQQPVGRDPG
jgi:DNA-binding HxlR family transcriptional regulator